MAKVVIDRGGCIGCGMCWGTCPSVYEQNPEDNLSQIAAALQENGNLSESTIDAALEDCAQQGADVCPVSVITVA